MQFSDTTNKQGILQDCETLVFGGNYGDITGNSNRLKRFTAAANRACDVVTSWIMESDHRWQWDDSNNTDLPIGTHALTTDQQDYSFDTEHLRVTRVEIKDTTGAWKLLIPIDQTDIYNQSLTNFKNASGTPEYYDKLGSSIFLYPKPSYTQADSLKVYFQRAHNYFVSTDDTKTPGFPSIFHRLISLLASYDYAIANNLKVAGGIGLEVEKMKESLQEFFAARSRDEHIRLTTRKTNYR